jgi:hypothetical protein
MSNLSVESSDLLAAFAALLGALRACVKEAVAEAVRQERRAFVEAEPALAARIAEINAKVNITVPEGALLLGCSDSHLYRLIGEARKGQSKRPIPYLDLDGVKVLQRERLLEWARPRALRAA